MGDENLFRDEHQYWIDKCDDLEQEQGRLENELSESKSNERRLRKEMDELREESKRTQKSLLDTLDAYRKVREERQRLLDERNECDKSKKDAAEEQIQGIGSQVTQMLTMTTDRVKHLESKVEDLTARLQAATDDGMVLQLKAEKSKNKLRDCRQDKAIYKSNLKTREAYARNLEAQLAEAHSECTKTAGDLKRMSEARDKEAARVTQLKQDVETAKRTAHSHEDESERLRRELEAAKTSQKTESDKLRRELETVQTKLHTEKNTSQATQMKLDQEQKKLQEVNEQLDDTRTKLADEQEKLRETTEELDQKRARILQIEQPDRSPDNRRKRRRSRSPERDSPLELNWRHAPDWLLKNLNLIQLYQPPEEGYLSVNEVFHAVYPLLGIESSYRALKEFYEYAEPNQCYCFNTVLKCETDQKAANISLKECEVHKDSQDERCIPVQFWLSKGDKVFTFYV